MIDKQEKIMLTTEVLNCDYFNRNRGFNCYKGKNCAEVPDCYYKQLKRKTQECEQLKEINAEIQESEIELENMKNSLFIDYMKYKQAIEEIEKIARLHAPMCNGCNRDEFNCDICHLYDLKNIIQKCKEVERKDRNEKIYI